MENKEKAKTTEDEKKINFKEEAKQSEIKRTASKLIKALPKNLVIKTLNLPITGTNVVLLGVDRKSPVHASYLHGYFLHRTCLTLKNFLDVMNDLAPDAIFTQIAPDSPFLIRTQEDYNVISGFLLKVSFFGSDLTGSGGVVGFSSFNFSP